VNFCLGQASPLVFETNYLSKAVFPARALKPECPAMHYSSCGVCHPHGICGRWRLPRAWRTAGDWHARPAQCTASLRGLPQSKQEEDLMPALLFLSLLLALSFSPAEGRTPRARVGGGSVPNLDIESGCRSLSQYDPGKTVNFDACIKEEHDVREQLQKSWGSVPASTREQCLHLVTPPALPSYVALQGCLTIAHDAAELAKKGRPSPYAEPLPPASQENRPPRTTRARRPPNNETIAKP
jgi:hypothetical protein